jgi:hypothetical protein
VRVGLHDVAQRCRSFTVCASLAAGGSTSVGRSLSARDSLNETHPIVMVLYLSVLQHLVQAAAHQSPSCMAGWGRNLVKVHTMQRTRSAQARHFKVMPPVCMGRRSSKIATRKVRPPPGKMCDRSVTAAKKHICMHADKSRCAQSKAVWQNREADCSSCQSRRYRCCGQSQTQGGPQASAAGIDTKRHH